MISHDTTAHDPVPTIKSEDEVFEAIFKKEKKVPPKAVFRIAERFVNVRTDVGYYTFERSVFSVGVNASGQKCLVIDITDGISDEPKLYVDLDTVGDFAGLSQVKAKDALRFADRNYQAFEKLVADLNDAVIHELDGTTSYTTSEEAYDGYLSDRAYIYERART